MRIAIIASVLIFIFYGCGDEPEDVPWHTVARGIIADVQYQGSPGTFWENPAIIIKVEFYSGEILITRIHNPVVMKKGKCMIIQRRRSNIFTSPYSIRAIPCEDN